MAYIKILNWVCKCYDELEPADRKKVMTYLEELHELRTYQGRLLKKHPEKAEIYPDIESEVSDSDDDLRDAWTGFYRGAQRDGNTIFPGWA